MDILRIQYIYYAAKCTIHHIQLSQHGTILKKSHYCSKFTIICSLHWKNYVWLSHHEMMCLHACMILAYYCALNCSQAHQRSKTDKSYEPVLYLKRKVDESGLWLPCSTNLNPSSEEWASAITACMLISRRWPLPSRLWAPTCDPSLERAVIWVFVAGFWRCGVCALVLISYLDRSTCGNPGWTMPPLPDRAPKAGTKLGPQRDTRLLYIRR